jgi:hypothetical protein
MMNRIDDFQENSSLMSWLTNSTDGTGDLNNAVITEIIDDTRSTITDLKTAWEKALGTTKTFSKDLKSSAAHQFIDSLTFTQVSQQLY